MKSGQGSFKHPMASSTGKKGDDEPLLGPLPPWALGVAAGVALFLLIIVITLHVIIMRKRRKSRRMRKKKELEKMNAAMVAEESQSQPQSQQPLLGREPSPDPTLATATSLASVDRLKSLTVEESDMKSGTVGDQRASTSSVEPLTSTTGVSSKKKSPRVRWAHPRSTRAVQSTVISTTAPSSLEVRKVKTASKSLTETSGPAMKKKSKKFVVSDDSMTTLPSVTARNSSERESLQSTTVINDE